MTEIAVYDPPMCCSSGVCGPDADETLVQFAAQLEWAGKNGVSVKRFNLGHNPDAFATNATVRELLQSEGMSCLPLVIADNEVLTKGGYPNAREFRDRIGIEAAPAPTTAKACCGGSEQNAKTSCCG